MTSAHPETIPLVLSDTEYLVEPLPEIWFGVVILALGGYLLLDGFDFGLGILYAEADDDERETMLAAFGPVWKANEVWLVLFGTVLLAGFPEVYANLLSRHYLLAFAILLALILRGLGAKLREEDVGDRWVRFWDRCFVTGSVLAPFLLGTFVASWILGAPSALAIGPILVGITVVILTVVLGAAFLAVKTDGELRERAVHRGRVATGCYVLALVLTAVVLYVQYPNLGPTLLSIPTAVIVLATIGFSGIGVYAGAASRYRDLVLASGGIAVAFVGLVAHLLYPAIDPAAGLVIRDAIVSPLALNLASIMAAVFLPVIGFYFVFLYSLFRGPPRPTDGYV